MHAVGHNAVTSEEVTKIMKEADLNEDKSISFKEFLLMINKYTSHSFVKRSSFSEMVNKAG